MTPHGETHRESREDVERTLADLGWEVLQTGDEASGAVVGGHGKYHLMVSFEGGEPTSVIISHVARGGGILSKRWAGAGCLPSPRKVVRALS